MASYTNGVLKAPQEFQHTYRASIADGNVWYNWPRTTGNESLTRWNLPGNGFTRLRPNRLSNLQPTWEQASCKDQTLSKSRKRPLTLTHSEYNPPDFVINAHKEALHKIESNQYAPITVVPSHPHTESRFNPSHRACRYSSRPYQMSIPYFTAKPLTLRRKSRSTAELTRVY